MVKYARLLWEIEIPDKPTRQDMESVLQDLLTTIESYVGEKRVHENDISDIEICNIPYKITGKSFYELMMRK